MFGRAISAALATAFWTMAAIAAPAPTPAPLKADAEGLTIHQQDKLVGEQIIYVRKDAVKIVNARKHFIVLLKAPQWNIVLYNPANKRFFASPIGNFTSSFVMAHPILSGDYLRSMPLKKQEGERQVICGFACDSYGMQSRVTARRRKMYDGYEVDMREEQKVSQAKYLTSAAVPVAPAVCAFLQKLYAIPTKPGFPLSLVMTLDNNDVFKELETTSIEKSVFPKTMFDEPKNFTKVATEQQVVFDSKDTALNRTINLFDDWRDAWGSEKGSEKGPEKGSEK